MLVKLVGQRAPAGVVSMSEHVLLLQLKASRDLGLVFCSSHSTLCGKEMTRFTALNSMQIGVMVDIEANLMTHDLNRTEISMWMDMLSAYYSLIDGLW